LIEHVPEPTISRLEFAAASFMRPEIRGGLAAALREFGVPEA
jgi:hypothetical protein